MKKRLVFNEEAESMAPVMPPQANPQTDSVINVQHLTKKFHGEAVVDDISFEIPYGKIFGFIGPSGSGKTTTIRLLTGYYGPTDGEIRIFGKNPILFHRRERSAMGYMPQLFVLYPNLTVWENMNFAASLYGMNPFRSKRIHAALAFVELDDHRHELARNISGGMQRRLSLASTLVHNPTLIFLDEPTAGIDPILRRKFWDRFLELKKQGATIFITTQYVTEADNCDLVGVMSGGKLLIVDTPRAIRHKAYGGEMVDIVTEEPFNLQTEMKIRELPFISEKTYRTGPNSLRLITDEASIAMPKIVEWTQEQNLKVKTLEEYTPSFEDVFVELVRQGAQNG